MKISTIILHKNSLIIILLISLIIFVMPSYAQFYTGSQQSFGKNRIQYTKDRIWSYFRFNNFDTYYYKGGKSLAIYASSYADKQMKVISRKLDFSADSKIKFLVFNDLSDLKETNIGLITDEEYNTGGVTHVINNKVFIYFNGEHHDFELQIKRGIAQVYLNEIMYGGSTGAKIKNSILLAFPTWYTDGLISYLSESWSTKMDDIIRDGIKTNKYEKFDRLDRRQQRYAGHSIWKFIEDKYGSKVIADVVYMAKVNRNIENGFLYVLGLSYKGLLEEWLDYYKKRYSRDFEMFSQPIDPALKRNRIRRKYAQARISPDGRYLAYTTNELGKVKVIVRDLEKNKKRKILKYGYKLDEKVDYHYPLLAWSPKGNYLSIIYEKKNYNVLAIYDYKKRKKRIRYLNQFDKVHDFSYNKRGNKYAISATKNGQSDIYVYSLGGNSFQRITHDAFDDYYPRFVNNSTALVWSSNRVDDTLRIIEQKAHQIAEDTIRGSRNNDLFFYDLTKPSIVLQRITNTPLADEVYPMAVAHNKFAWLSNENGVYNRYVGAFDSTISYIDTTTHYRYFTNYFAVSNYSSSIIEQDYNNYADKYSEIVQVNGKTRIFVKHIPEFEDYDRQKLEMTAYMADISNRMHIREVREEALRKYLKKIAEGDSSNINKKNVVKLTPNAVRKKRFRVVTADEFNTSNSRSNIDINNYNFGGEKVKKDNSSAVALEAARKRGPSDAIRAAYNSRPYNVEYSVSQIVTQVDFNYLNTGYQPFTNPQSPIYLNQGFNAFIKLGVMDLLEDYRLVGGVKIDPSFRNNEYILTFSDYKNRLDKDYTFHRNVIDDYREDRILTHYIHEFYLKVGLPFDNIRGLRLSMALRNDNTVTRATDTKALTEPDVMLNNAIVKLEYVYDKSRNKGVNILFGTRYKVWGEYYQPLEYLHKNLIVLGFDFRKYIQIHKTFVWANRVAGSTSLGTERLIYYMGGVDNWINADFNKDIQVDQEQNFIYQTIATNMRGFTQNIRNGNNFLLINSELRLPPFQYFSKKPITSPFWNNFMIVGFFDLGTAWTGANPFTDKNSLFRKSIYRDPVKITIINQDDPIVAGYGFGLRSQVFGYYLRADWAWGISNGYVHEKPVFYFSLSLDF